MGGFSMFDPPLVFMHIPKTGGMAIDAWLASSFCPHVWWHPSDYIQPVSADPPCEAGVIVGHTPADYRGSYVTVLRHPVERVASLYYAHMGYGDFPHRGLSLREFVETAPYPEVDNGMTRRLAGRLDVNAAKHRLSDFVYVAKSPNDLVRWVSEYMPPPRSVPFVAMNVNLERPAIAAADRRFIEAHNSLDMELFEVAFG